MKRGIFSLLFLWFSVHAVDAQTVKKTGQKKSGTQKMATAKSIRKNSNAQQNTVKLQAVSNNQAYGSLVSESYTISDPTVRALNQRAAGYNVFIGSSGIVGMPKRKYGFANGKLLLRSTTAPSSGTNYGSGAVGTGTSIMGVGTGENAIGVNGKNPYAGPWLWGSRLPNKTQSVTDSTRQR